MCDVFCVKYTKNVKFLSGSRGHHGPDLHRPAGENFGFQPEIHTRRSVFQLQEGLSKSVFGTMMTDQFNSISIDRKVSEIGLSMDTGPALYF